MGNILRNLHQTPVGSEKYFVLSVCVFASLSECTWCITCTTQRQKEDHVLKIHRERMLSLVGHNYTLLMAWIHMQIQLGRNTSLRMCVWSKPVTLLLGSVNCKTSRIFLKDTFSADCTKAFYEEILKPKAFLVSQFFFVKVSQSFLALYWNVFSLLLLLLFSKGFVYKELFGFLSFPWGCGESYKTASPGVNCENEVTVLYSGWQFCHLLRPMLPIRVQFGFIDHVQSPVNRLSPFTHLSINRSKLDKCGSKF